MSQRWYEAGVALPGVVPCYVDPESNEDGISLHVTRRTLTRSFGLYGGGLFLFGLLVLAIAVWFLVLHLMGRPQASLALTLACLAVGVGMLILALWMIQTIASAELLVISPNACTYSRKRWWAWRDTTVDFDELKVVARPAYLNNELTPSLCVVTVDTGTRVLFAIAAERTARAEEACEYAKEIAEQTGLPLEYTERDIRVAGDIRLT